MLLQCGISDDITCKVVLPCAPTYIDCLAAGLGLGLEASKLTECRMNHQ